MSVFIETTIQCKKCGKKYKSFSGMENWAILDKGLFLPFCKECSKKLKKIVDNWMKTKKP